MEIDIPDPVITLETDFGKQSAGILTSHIIIAGVEVFSRTYTSDFARFDMPDYADDYFEAERKTLRAFAAGLKELLAPKGTDT
jgi:hypothetical protein